MSDEIFWKWDDTYESISPYDTISEIEHTIERLKEKIANGEWKNISLRQSDGDSRSLDFYGQRPETEKEKVQRLHQESVNAFNKERQQKQLEETERKEYERLKKKFEEK